MNQVRTNNTVESFHRKWNLLLGGKRSFGVVKDALAKIMNQ